MTILHMQTETVHTTARQMTQGGEQAALAVQSLSRALRSLQITWKGGSSEEFGLEAQDLLRRLNAQTDYLLELAARLEREVTEWEAADRNHGSALGWMHMTGANLPVAGGAWQGYSSVLALPAIVSISQFLTTLPPWLAKLIDRLFPPPEIISPIPDAPMGAKTVEETPLGKLIKEFEEENPPATPSGEPAAPPQEEQWWSDTPAYGQRGLQYNGKSTAYGCVPTSTQMVLDYWHQQSESNQTTSAQALLDLNSAQKEFTSTGMSIDEMRDEVGNLGYQTRDIHTGKDLSFLKEQVSQGPVIAVVHLDDKNNRLAASGVPHAVVVTGVSPESNEVRINDPWVGESVTYSWDDFNKSWGSSFGKDSKGNEYATNALLVIRP